MPKHNINKVRLEIAKELDDLASILEDERICDDVVPLRNAGSQCRAGQPGGNKKAWGYDLDRLIFRLGSFRHAVPVDIVDVAAELSVSVTGLCVDDDEDPFISLAVDVVIQARGLDSKKLYCSWHLDRHIKEDGDDDPKDAHPHYHLHYGGKRLKALASDFGEALLLDTPRLAHPPLDALLGVDFVLSNYMSIDWRRLRDDVPQYTKLIKKVQQRIWQPYAHTTNSHWERPPVDKAWSPEQIWPQLVSI
jgi:hypothetical protein